MEVRSKLKNYAYRAARRIVVVNNRQFFGIDACDLVCDSGPGPDIRTVVIEEPLALDTATQEFLGKDLMPLLNGASGLCTAAFRSSLPIAFAWWAFGDIPASRSHDGHPATGLPLKIPTDTAYLFNVYVSPEFRGQRLYSALVSHSQNTLRSKGKNRLALTTEYANHSALQSVERMGFQSMGVSKLIKIGPFAWATYPQSPMRNGVCVGNYTGDSRQTELEPTM